MQALIGTKKSQSQRFLENGMRIPVTLIDIKNNWVVGLKTQERDHYQAVQLGFGIKKHGKAAQLGHAKGAKLDKAPKFLREVPIVDDETLPEIGTAVNPLEVLQPGDIVNVSGFSKGKGFAGGVKRHGFHGGPKTHGQSDRHRAPGAIGQGTTPGRVYKGKRMAGKMGNENVTIEKLEVVDINENILTLKGLVPGVLNGLIVVKKVDTNKKFVPLWKDAVEEPVVEASEEQVSEPVEDTNEPAELSSDQPTDVDPSSEPLAEPEIMNAEEAPTTQDQTPAEAENVENDVTQEVAQDAKEGEEDANS